MQTYVYVKHTKKHANKQKIKTQNREYHVPVNLQSLSVTSYPVFISHTQNVSDSHICIHCRIGRTLHAGSI